MSCTCAIGCDLEEIITTVMECEEHQDGEIGQLEQFATQAWYGIQEGTAGDASPT